MSEIIELESSRERPDQRAQRCDEKFSPKDSLLAMRGFFSTIVQREKKGESNKKQFSARIDCLQSSSSEEIDFSFQEGFFAIEGKFFDLNDELVTVILNQHRKVITKEVNKKSVSCFLEPCSAVFYMQNGLWYLQTPKYSIGSKEKEFKASIIAALELFQYKKQIAFDILKKVCNSNSNIQKSSNFIQKQFDIQKYLIRSSTEPAITIKSESAEYQSVIEKYAASETDLQSLRKFNKTIHSQNRRSLSTVKLFGLDLQVDNKIHQLHPIELDEKQRIQLEIKISQYPARLYESKHLLTNVNFWSENYRAVQVCSTLNNKIYTIKCELYQRETFSENSDNQKCRLNSRYYPKQLIYKKPIKEQANDSHFMEDHEFQIVSLLKEGSCVNFPKYYINKDSGTNFYDQLFMDFVQGETLDIFLQLQKKTLSLPSKIYLLLQIVQACRFLAQHGVVHLDLKELNLIVTRRLGLKMIDFGQSYHYNLCGKSYKPKFSISCAAPEVVNSVAGREFTEKTDVFSFGMLMHLMLTAKMPYRLSTEAFFRNNRSLQLRQRTFYCPQQAESFGDGSIVPLLYQLCLKCLDLDEKRRPYCSWISLILKCCLHFFIDCFFIQFTE